MAYIINLHDYESRGDYWIAFYVNGDNGTYFDSFEVDHVPKENKRLIGNKNFYSNYL